MKNLSSSILLAGIMMISFSCKQGSTFAGDLPEKIQVGPGPEDMVLDTLNGPPRLLISCSARREEHKPYGELVSFDLRSNLKTELIRYNEPEDLRFKPHGIYLDGDRLYVISHEREPDYHPILLYKVRGDSLEFLELIHSPNQHSPNALVTGPEGEIYVVNDSGKRGSMAEKIFKLRRASVVRLSKNQDGQWDSKIVAEKLSYPAGINRIGNRLFAGDAIQNKFHVYEILADELLAVSEFKGLKGNDNIRIYNEKLLTVCHVKPSRFIKHAKNSEKLSPVEVFLVDPGTGQAASLFYTDGSLISGGSAAVVFENHLYICQIFEPFILKVELEQ